MRYVCIGRVHPERAYVSFNEIRLKSHNVTISCDHSQLTVVIDDDNLDGWLAARIAAEDIASVFVSSLGFCLGCGYSIEILNVVDETGSAHITSVKPRDERTGDALQIGVERFDSASRLSGKDIFFRLALNDYARALQEGTDCAFYCYRAIETIKNSFGGKWDDMHSTLQTERQDIDEKVKLYADPIRHGNCSEMQVMNKYHRWEALKTTRDVLVKYLDHQLKNGA